jgi:hypothetical protein
MLGLMLGCGFRRSEVVGLRLDQLQSREGHWVIIDLVGKGGRLRTLPVPLWCKELVEALDPAFARGRGNSFYCETSRTIVSLLVMVTAFQSDELAEAAHLNGVSVIAASVSGGYSVSQPSLQDTTPEVKQR